MDLKKFKKKFKKVETLLEMIDNAGEANEVEKDLLALYLKDLIEELGVEEKIEKEIPIKVEKKATPAVVLPEPEKIIEPAPEKIEVIEMAPAEIVEEVVVPSPVVKSTSDPLPPTKVQSTNGTNSVTEVAAFDRLFASETISDLSDKLSLTKVNNIGKSMGINEKIFTIKELFGGNQDAFSETMTSLDGMSNYEEAITYLKNGVARDYKWADEVNFKKAKKFLKLVQRRFV